MVKTLSLISVPLYRCCLAATVCAHFRTRQGRIAKVEDVVTSVTSCGWRSPTSTTGQDLLILVADDIIAAATDAAICHQLTLRGRRDAAAQPPCRRGLRVVTEFLPACAPGVWRSGCGSVSDRATKAPAVAGAAIPRSICCAKSDAHLLCRGHCRRWTQGGGTERIHRQGAHLHMPTCSAATVPLAVDLVADVVPTAAVPPMQMR